MSTIIVTQFETPDVNVTMSDISIDQLHYTFKLMLSINNMESQEVTGTVTRELVEWLSIMKPVRVKVVAQNEQGWEWMYTDQKLTNFQKYCKKLGLPISADTLEAFEFTSQNRGGKYMDCPFRLSMLKDKNILTMVNVPSKKVMTVRDEVTGETRSKFSTKIGKFADGSRVKAFIKPENYRRLIVYRESERQVYVEPTQDPQPQQQAENSGQ